MTRALLLVLVLLGVIGSGFSFVLPSSVVTTTSQSDSAVYLSDVPQDETEKSTSSSSQESPPQQRKQQQQKANDTWQHQQRQQRNWKQNWLPEPPEDQLTLAGDVASLFLYSFMDHFLNDVYLTSLLKSSDSAAEAAKSLDTTSLPLPVWVDSTALGTQTVDHLLLTDLQSRVLPHFSTPLLASAGMASVSLASCWLLAGILHQAFHFRNTLDCPTDRAIAVTGQTWITSSIFLIALTCISQHMAGGAAVDIQDVSTSVLMTQGRVLTPIEEWLSVLTRTDIQYIVDSLGVLLTWRFMISFLLGGWSKK
ncbi:FR47-like protein [Seminavis robusta]|uniref:FR47-like protein n=1 Tax=Seminavis robusta TaxID=568900 RepID=A0A9N8H715_9STRA|nr:FR47-like protein [Seminavis robusta]|eukprot:Sro128_g061140.1 FR47-like protein (309) ;mRNA; r:35411-36337